MESTARPVPVQASGGFDHGWGDVDAVTALEVLRKRLRHPADAAAEIERAMMPHCNSPLVQYAEYLSRLRTA